MTQSRRYFIAALIALSIGLFAHITTARAQNCAGGTITITNSTTAVVDICINTTAGRLCATGMLPGASATFPGLPIPTTITGVEGNSGTNYALIAPPPAWRLLDVQLGPNPGAGCYNVMYTPATCTLSIFTCGCPLPCTNP